MSDEKNNLFDKLPQGFREKFTQEILSRTTPADVARLSLVSKSFHSSANSDVVWDRFIPPQHRKLVLHATRYCNFNSSKKMFLYFCLLEYPEKSNDPLRFRIDQWTGKMCLNIKHQELEITQLDTDYWKKNLYGNPELGHVLWLEVRGILPTSRLSPDTAYEAFLVFTLSDYVCYGIHIPIEASVGIQGEESTKEIIYLDPRLAKSKSNHHYPTIKPIDIGFLIEVKLGEFFNKEGENRDLEITLKEVKSGRPKCGVQIKQMEMRPKHDDTKFMTVSVSRCNFKLEKPSVMAGEDYENLDFFRRLPEECIEEVVSRTSPIEACRLSLVSKRFLSATESNFVWEKFLPSDYQQLLDRAYANFRNNIKFSHKKDLFLFLIGNHVIMDGNTVCFWLNKRTGKKCFLISASITGHIYEHGYTQHGWCRRSEKSRFQNRMTQCSNVILFELHGKMNTSILSPYTSYTIYLVFDSSIYMDQKFDEPVEVSIGTNGVESIKKIVYLNPHKMMSKGDNYLQYPIQRKDDKFEVELGEYFSRGGVGVNLEITMMEVKSGKPKNGPSIEGFEFRLKEASNAVL